MAAEELSNDNAERWFDVDGNQLKLVQRAKDRLTAITGLIETAENSIKIFFYMFEDDAIGRLILNRLIEALGRGVRVELMLDSFGSNGTTQSFFDPFVEAGGKFAIFSPRFSTSYFVRNHQKMIIADDHKALIGGFNIAESYFDLREEADKNRGDNKYWEDIALVIRGPEVNVLAEYYTRLSQWVHTENGQLRSLQKMVRNWQANEGIFRWLLGGPSNRMSPWARAIKKDLENGNRLDLITAYFSPGQGLLRRMARIAKRGGTSRLLLPGKSDNNATIGASRLLYGFLLKRGAKISEFQPNRLHGKLVVVNDAVYIGSANFDLRSLFINVEMMLRIEDRAFADHARALVTDMHKNALPITTDLHKSRLSLINRLRWTLSYFIVNTLDYSVNRRFNFGIKK